METINANNVADVLREKLQQGEVNFVFKKKDGTRRPARGTLKLELVPEKDKQFATPQEDKPQRDDQVTYYDLEKMAWRCCKSENILSIEGVDVE